MAFGPDEKHFEDGDHRWSSWGVDHGYWGAHDESGRPVILRGEKHEPLPALTAYWAIDDVKNRAEAVELWALREEITALVLTNHEVTKQKAQPYAGMEAMLWGRTTASQTTPRLRLAAERLPEGGWRIRDYDFGAWEGVVGRSV